jgi:acetolactate synthase regulatory subunit
VSAAESQPRSTWCFSVFAAPEPGVIPRVLELFAKRGLVPGRFHADMTGARSGGLEIDVQVTGLDDAAAGHVANCLRGLFDVERVLVATKQAARTAAAGAL